MAHLYERSGDIVVPSPLTRGPWDPQAQHGGPVAALLAGSIERYPADAPMMVARLTLDLLRPVPLTPLRLELEPVRGGRRRDVIAAMLHADDLEVARGIGLRLRVEDLAVPPSPMHRPAPRRGDAPVQWWAEYEFAPDGDRSTYHFSAVEICMTAGNFAVPGPATGWVRLRQPVVAGTEPCGAERVAAAADMINGMGSFVSPRSFTFINPDLTFHLARPVQGEWIGLEAESTGYRSGTGAAAARIYDDLGSVGMSQQSLLFEPSA